MNTENETINPSESSIDADAEPKSEGVAESEGQAVESDLAELQDELGRLALERAQLQEQVLRTMADFQNFRKRALAEAATTRQFATENFVTALLPVLDNFERTIAHIDSGATIESLTEGIRAVDRQLRSVLEGQSVKRIISVGQPFDPNLHEALGTDIDPNLPEETVTVEIEAGYKMADKVIRPARVKVSKQS